MKKLLILLITLQLFSCGKNFHSKEFDANTELAKAYFQLHEEENAESMFEFLHPKATFDALLQLRSAETVAKQRGISLDKLFKG